MCVRSFMPPQQHPWPSHLEIPRVCMYVCMYVCVCVFVCVCVCTRYAMSLIGGTTSSASFVNLYERFGPTYAGKYDEERGTYALGYPGLLFHFPIPKKYAADCLSRPGELPLEFPDGTTPVASRLCVFGGTVSSDGSGVATRDASGVSGGASDTGGGGAGSSGIPIVNTSLIVKGLRYFEEVRVCLGEGGGLRFANGAKLSFGDSPQDVWTQLGAPGDTFHKPLGKMLLHSGADDAERGGAATPDYFYNYFTRGIDVLFDGASHRAKKFVLHSNQVGHPDFNVYVKCNFVVEVPAEEGEDADEVATAAEVPRTGSGTVDTSGRGGVAATDGLTLMGDDSIGMVDEGNDGDIGDGEDALFPISLSDGVDDARAISAIDDEFVHEKRVRIKGLIRADSSFSDVQRLLGDGGRATIHTQFISGSSSNPFGSTFIYGFRQRITFEVMKSGRVANITVF